MTRFYKGVLVADIIAVTDAASEDRVIITFRHSQHKEIRDGTVAEWVEAIERICEEQELHRLSSMVLPEGVYGGTRVPFIRIENADDQEGS